MMGSSTTRVAYALGLATMLAFGIQLPAQAASGRSGGSCAGEVRPDRLQGLTPDGDLVLASEGLAKLAGLRFPDDPPHREQALAWLRARMDRPLVIQGSESRDRWNRRLVRIRQSDGPTPLDLAHGLVEAGLALVDPGADDAFCQPELLALEETARERSLGLWADDGYKPIDVALSDRLRDRIGRFVLVEGRIRSVGERPHRTYLNFGGHWAEDFTIIIPQRTWKRMAERGLSAEALKGRRIRARGILQSWQGTALTIVIPEMIERLGDGRLEGTRLAR
jgi:hypothetical protein